MSYNRERLLSFDPLTGLAEWHSYDDDTDTTTIRTVGDCEPFLEQNKRMANDSEYTKLGIKGEFWHYASIPPAFQVKLLVEQGIDVYNRNHAERLSRILEDSDYKHLKTTTKYHKFK